MEKSESSPRGFACTVCHDGSVLRWSIQSEALSMVCDYRSGSGLGRKMLLTLAVVASSAVVLVSGNGKLLVHSLLQIFQELQLSVK